MGGSQKGISKENKYTKEKNIQIYESLCDDDDVFLYK
jgi:hypothetical protein